MSRPVISIENLSKAYRIGLKEEIPDTLTSAVLGFAKAPWRRFQELRRLNTFSHAGDAADIVWALKDVSFEVQEGEVLGVIGRNGAGKSTLLKILSRITEPTSGRAVIRGRVSSLLEVGTGFHPELSGRENVYLNGTILGMTKREIDRKFDEIVDFSGVEKFLDTPIKRYSSGMKVRLAFAVAAHLDPEILIIDEVLAVGDAEFQKKCLGKMQDVARGGRTVLFVSHNLPSIEALTARSILLADGLLVSHGETHSVIQRYAGNNSELLAEWSLTRQAAVDKPRIVNVRILDSQLNLCFAVNADESIYIEVTFETPSPQSLQIAVRINDTTDDSTVLTSAHCDAQEQQSTPFRSGSHTQRCLIPGTFLAPGTYYVLAAINETAGPSAVQSLHLVDRSVCFQVRDERSLARLDHRIGAVLPILPWSSV
jgi:lipopolysaccharide transport system ATP-binding protein